jgi:hypothetical protein
MSFESDHPRHSLTRTQGSTRSTAFNNYDNTKIMNQNEVQNIYGGQYISF